MAQAKILRMRCVLSPIASGVKQPKILSVVRAAELDRNVMVDVRRRAAKWLETADTLPVLHLSEPSNVIFAVFASNTFELVTTLTSVRLKVFLSVCVVTLGLGLVLFGIISAPLFLLLSANLFANSPLLRREARPSRAPWSMLFANSSQLRRMPASGLLEYLCTLFAITLCSARTIPDCRVRRGIGADPIF